MKVLNIRLNRRGSVSVPFDPHTGHCASGCPGRALDALVVGPEAVLALLAVHQRIGEAGDVAGRLPDPRMHQDRGIEPLDVVAGMDHRPPPAVLDVLLELDAQRAVIPHGAEAPVDLGRLEHEAPPLGQRHELFHEGVFGHVHERKRKRKSFRGVKIAPQGGKIKAAARWSYESASTTRLHIGLVVEDGWRDPEVPVADPGVDPGPPQPFGHGPFGREGEAQDRARWSRAASPG